MKKMITKSVLVATTVFAFSGCVGQPELTPEQIQQQKEMQALFMKRLKEQWGGSKTADKEVEKPKVEEIKAISQEELQNKLSSFGTASSPVQIEKTKSGFNINGKPFSDYEGSITSAAWDNITGYITYLVKTSQDSYSMKFMQATSSQEPLIVGNVAFEDGVWTVKTITGKKLSGDTLLVGSDGFVVTRVDGSGFSYNHAKGVKSINVPSEYQVAKFQNGDILGTKTILLEIPEAKENDNGGLSSVWSSMKAVGSSLGINKKQDYAFMNIETGAISKINIPNNGKSQLGECLKYDPKPYSKHVQKCLQYAPAEDTLYDRKGGGKNVSHYFWRVVWLNSTSGVIAITQEDSLGKIYATNLTTNKKVLIAEKLGGFAGFEVSTQPNGKINVTANKGLFGNDLVEDVEEKIKTLPAVVEEETK